MSVNDFDEELHDAIADLVAQGEIEANSAAHGIARQVIDLGYMSLSAAQKYIYDTQVIPALKRRARELEAIRAQHRD